MTDLPDQSPQKETTASPIGGLEKLHKALFALGVVAILCLAGLLRISGLRNNPPGFFCDEASIGYNAYTLSQTGQDEHGERFPLFFKAFGEYKNPVYIYFATPFVAALGLDELSTRLPAAVFGILTVLFTALLFREMFGRLEGLVAALLLSISNWHVHFSRIAFELISFPCLFTLGLLFLYKGTRQKARHLPLGAFFIGLSLYAYGSARVFIPLFSLGYVLLFWKDLWTRRLLSALAGLVFLVTLTPMICWTLKYPERANARFNQVSIFREHRGPQKTAQRYLQHYARHFSYDFLFKTGDPICRHAVKSFGELYRPDIPFYVLGLTALLFSRRKEGFLLIGWLLLFPCAASLTLEVPSATRSIVAIPALPGIAGMGLALVIRSLACRRGILRLASLAALLAYAGFMGTEFYRYLSAYYKQYPTYASEGVYGFQHGYGKLIQTMLSQSRNYDRLIISTCDSNRPEILLDFYHAGYKGKDLDPKAKSKFQLFLPDDYDRYATTENILFGIRPKEAVIFQDYTLIAEITGTQGQKPFLLVRPHKRKVFIRPWTVVGPFDNSRGMGERTDDIDVNQVSMDQEYEGRYGMVRWESASFVTTRIDLWSQYAGVCAGHPGDPATVSAYALTSIHSPSSRSAFLELTASKDVALPYLGGHSLTDRGVLLTPEPTRIPFSLPEGVTPLMLKVCNDDGEWFFSARICDADGQDLTDLTFTPGLSGPEDIVSSELQEIQTAPAVHQDSLVPAPIEDPASSQKPVLSQDNPGSKPGLRAVYYRNGDLSGASAGVWRLRVFQFEYTDEKKKPVSSPFSVRWTGYITIDEAGPYRFATESDDGSRLWIGDCLVVDNWGEHDKRYQCGNVDLAQGLYSIKIEYLDLRWNASLSVFWKPPSQEEVLLPDSVLSHP